MSFLIAGSLITIFSLCAGITIGYRLAQGRSPLPSAGEVRDAVIDDMPGPISPSEEARKTRRETVKVNRR